MAMVEADEEFIDISSCLGGPHCADAGGSGASNGGMLSGMCGGVVGGALGGRTARAGRTHPGVAGHAACLSVGQCAGPSSSEIAWVGVGQEAYTTETKYRFVGMGAGNFNYADEGSGPEFTTMCVSLCILMLPLAVTIAVVMLLWPHPMTTTPALVGPPASCLIWGDMRPNS